MFIQTHKIARCKECKSINIEFVKTIRQDGYDEIMRCKGCGREVVRNTFRTNCSQKDKMWDMINISSDLINLYEDI